MKPIIILIQVSTVVYWLLLVTSASVLFTCGQKTLACILLISATLTALAKCVLLAKRQNLLSDIFSTVGLMIACCIGALISFKINRLSLALSAAACGIVLNQLVAFHPEIQESMKSQPKGASGHDQQ